MVCGAWARVRGASSGGPRWSGWSSGRRSGGCISSASCRSARSIAGRGCIATRSGGRWPARCRRSIERAPAGSKLDPFKTEIGRLLDADPDLPGRRVGELSEPLGLTAARRSWMTTCARSGRCFRPSGRRSARSTGPGRSASSTSGSPARDPGRPRPDPQGLCRGRVPGLLARRRRRADLQQADPGSAGRDPALSLEAGRRWRETLVWDRQAGIHAYEAGRRRSSPRSAASCGSAGTSAASATRRPRASSSAGRATPRRNFEPGRVFANELDFQDAVRRLGREGQRAPAPHDPGPADRPPRRGARGHGPAAAVAPDTDRRWVLRVAPDPYVRFDGCDYSLDPDLVGRRVEVRVGDRELTRPRWTPASWPAGTRGRLRKHRTITALEHARALKRRARAAPRRAVVQTRSLDVYDRLIA